jgi:hypothetical protein
LLFDCIGFEYVFASPEQIHNLHLLQFARGFPHQLTKRRGARQKTKPMLVFDGEGKNGDNSRVL